MSSLSTLEESQAIAADLALPRSAYIDGKFRTAQNGETFDSVSPTNGGVLASITACGQEDVDHAVLKARAIRAGTVTVNRFGEGDITTPFWGYKQSGFGGRDNSLHAHDQYTELKTIWLDISDQDVESSLE